MLSRIDRIQLAVADRHAAALAFTRLLDAAVAGEDAVAALLALGYRESQVKGVVAELAQSDPDATAETLIRKALAKLR